MNVPNVPLFPSGDAREMDASLVLSRSRSATGGSHTIAVTLDGEPIGNLNEGDTLTVKITRGQHTIHFGGGGLYRSQTITTQSGQVLEFETYFSNWGIIGGGVILRPINHLADEATKIPGSQKHSQVTAIGVAISVSTALLIALVCILWGKAILAAIIFVATTVIGVVITLVIAMAFAFSEHRHCKCCFLRIPSLATVCPFCTRDLQGK